MAHIKLGELREELLGRLGTAPDNVLAKEFGLTRERIRQLRKERRIPVFIKTLKGPKRPVVDRKVLRERILLRRKEREKAYLSELSSLKKFEFTPSR